MTSDLDETVAAPSEDAGEHAGTATAESVRIDADIVSSFTYASYQNAIPVIRSIAVLNATPRILERCTLELTSEPPFLRAKTWTIDRILAGDTLTPSDRKIELDAGYLAGLNEAERGEITLRLSADGASLAEARIPVRLLARDEWGGVADMAQLLPAFVMPNDPAVAAILRSAAESLAAHGHPSGLDGYQSGSSQRAFMLTAAVYSAIAGMSLHYAEPPASFESRGQKVRRPTTIAAEKLATCLDTSLLFASAIEAAGLNPVVVMFDGHAAAGVWLTQKTFSAAVEPDPMEVRKALAARELIVFETTGVTHRPVMTLETAQRALDHRLDEAETGRFVAAIDIRRSRSGGITPLASHAPVGGNAEDEPTEEAGALPLPAAPPMAEQPPETVEVKPTTAAGRIDRWQRKLLDLTLRNRLLNFADTKRTIPFLCTDVGYLEDRLAKGAAIRLISLPEQNPLGERDPALYREVHGRDLQRSFAAEALERGELPSTLEAKELTARLIELYRQARNDLAEGGANTLYLAVGFLRWKKQPADERSYRAPLLLVPVKLERRSASSQFALRFHEDEPRFNATLLQFLERDLALPLPQLGGELPLDENGIDVPRLLDTMRHAVRDVPGMEVVDETALSTFSFAKFLMWKDLVERTDALRRNRVVRHLIDTPEQVFEGSAEDGAFQDERALDRRYAPKDIVSLLPADSSQMAASIAAAEGHDFVIVGPPGTGKSQTIANMIANCLAAGKSVLFVAEKTAALDVVYRRLREHGLGGHCLELHSNKADRRRFLGQLKASWEKRGRFDESEWVKVNERLRLRRDELNAYVDALHRRYPNGWTPYRAMGLTLKHRETHAPELAWPREVVHDEAAFLSLDALSAEIGLTFASVEMRPALRLVDAGEWTSRWQDDLIAASERLRSAIRAAGVATGSFLSAIGLPHDEDVSRGEMTTLARLAEALQRSAGHDVSVAFDREIGMLRQALSELEGRIRAHDAARRELSADYDLASLTGRDVDAITRSWREAAATFWPFSFFARRKVRKRLQGHVARGIAEPETDLAPLRIIMECRAAAEASPLAGKPVAFAGIETDIGGLGETLTLAEALRDALRLPGRSKEDAVTVLRAVAPLLKGAVDDRVRPAAGRLLDAVAALDAALRRFAELAGTEPPLSAEDDRLAAFDRSLDELAASRHLLRDWATWCGVRRRSVAQGLAPLVADIETGAMPAGEAQPAFRLAYARWWVPPVLDDDPVLRGFRRFQHENALSDFREIDDLVRARASDRVAGAIAHDLPAVQSVPRKSELGLLRHQMELQRPSRSIREMIGAMPETFSKLAPCMLMSPLSIAQYLPPDQALFDVVIFDEASQITTWDAVGAIARASQTIIVGDPKQLPPTNFFGRNEDEDDAEIEDYDRDLESILDETKAAGIPVRDLRWHYRSRSESLIAFSNHHYYMNRLVTFPSPTVEDRAVRLRKVPEGIYDRGKSRTNRIEAEAVAAEAVARMRAWLALDERGRPTLGIITFNAQQQSLILDLLDRARQEEPALEWFFAEERVEPTIVKNLENVQGDERDVILFSITFAQDSAGKRSMDFGALNRDGGERRLNVAVTRARQELVVFSGFTADLIDTGRTKAVGVHHLKAYLDYAERGAIALPAQDTGSAGELESPFEEAVAEALTKRGWMVVPQVGISGLRIDIGVRHPDLAGAYLAGVECDGATYHGSATARDRDKVREQVLRGLGWAITRVWSTDWWFDPDGCAERLHTTLEALLEESRRKRAEEPPAEGGAGTWEMGQEVDPAAPLPEGEAPPPETDAPPTSPDEAEMGEDDETGEADVVAEVEPVVTPASGDAEGAPGSGAGQGETRAYRVTDLSAFDADPQRFFDPDYRDTLSAMVQAVLDQESPLRRDVLAQRIARAHGWLRTGARIRERIDRDLRGAEETAESSGSFIWKTGSVTEIMEYRPPADAQSRRSIADIPLAELAAIAIANRALLDQPDPARDLARLLGVERLAAASRARLDEALERARSRIESPEV